MHRKKPLQILLVEDNPTDVLLTKQALEYANIPHSLSVVKDGVEAIKYLNKINGYGESHRPDFIFLDLNLPRKSGMEVLTEIKALQGLKSIPVIVLSTSAAATDVDQAYKEHANCYVVKPSNFDEFVSAFNSLLGFWSNLVTLPAE